MLPVATIYSVLIISGGSLVHLHIAGARFQSCGLDCFATCRRITQCGRMLCPFFRLAISKVLVCLGWTGFPPAVVSMRRGAALALLASGARSRSGLSQVSHFALLVSCISHVNQEKYTYLTQLAAPGWQSRGLESS